MNETATLNGIREGASVVAMIARARLGEALDALERGEFRNAQERTQEAMNRLTGLADAEHLLGTFASMTIKRAIDVVEGDHLYGLGVVSGMQIEIHDEGRPSEHEMVRVNFEDASEGLWPSQTELVVGRALP